MASIFSSVIDLSCAGGRCPPCGDVIRYSCCGLSEGDGTEIPETLLVTLDLVDHGTPFPYVCSDFDGNPFEAFIKALYPLGGNGTSFNVTYVFDMMDPDYDKWVGTYTACDGTTVAGRELLVNTSDLGDCLWVSNFYNPSFSEDSLAGGSRHFGGSGDGCTIDDVHDPVYWAAIISGDGGTVSGLQATLQE